jgi:hypothetical protein
MVIGLVATIAWAAVAGAIGYPFARAWARRIEGRHAPRDDGGGGSLPDVSARLSRIETALDSIALEVERVAEAQRFLTKLQTERTPLGSGATPADRPR